MVLNNSYSDDVVVTVLRFATKRSLQMFSTSAPLRPSLLKPGDALIAAISSVDSPHLEAKYNRSFAFSKFVGGGTNRV